MDLEWNPYLSDQLLEHVFEYCSFDTLYTVRQVCRRWESRSKVYWRRRAALKISVEPDSYYAVSLGTLSEMYNTEDDAFQLRQFAFRRYSMDSELLTLDSPIMDQIWPTVECLSVFQASVSVLTRRTLLKATSLRRLILLSPNLATDDAGPVHQDDVDENSGENRSLSKLDIIDAIIWNAGAWRSFLQVATSLDTINLETAPEIAHFCTGDLLNEIKNVRSQRPACLKIKSFKVNVDGLSHFPSLINACRFQLQSISLESEGFSVPNSVSALLQEHASTLTELDDFQRHAGWALGFNLDDWDFGPPKYKSVRWWRQKEVLPKLEMYNAFSGLFNAMWYLRNLVANNLKTLRIELYTLHLSEEIRGRAFFFERIMTSHESFKELMGTLYFSTVTTLVYKNQWNLLTVDAIASLARSLPALKHLKMPLSNANIVAVYKHWQQLESFTIYDTSLKNIKWDDKAIVGSDALSDGSTLSLPGIRNLKKLRMFKMERLYLEPRRFALTDLSAFHGFLLLPNLTALDVPFSKLSRDCHNELKKHVRCLKICTPRLD